MDKESMLQAAEDEWLGSLKQSKQYCFNVEDCAWPWFWLILAESIWPEPEEIDSLTKLYEVIEKYDNEFFPHSN